MSLCEFHICCSKLVYNWVPGAFVFLQIIICTILLWPLVLICTTEKTTDLKSIASFSAYCPAKMLLKSILRENNWVISQSRPDGHCLLHSVVSSFKSQLPGSPSPKLCSLKSTIDSHIICNANDYIMYGINPTVLIKK